MWSNTCSRLSEFTNIFHCYKCQKKLDSSYIFGCRHAMYCKDCFTRDGLQCQINKNCDISRLEKFQNVLKLLNNMNVLINKEYNANTNTEDCHDSIINSNMNEVALKSCTENMQFNTNDQVKESNENIVSTSLPICGKLVSLLDFTHSANKIEIIKSQTVPEDSESTLTVAQEIEAANFDNLNVDCEGRKVEDCTLPSSSKRKKKRESLKKQDTAINYSTPIKNNGQLHSACVTPNSNLSVTKLKNLVTTPMLPLGVTPKSVFTPRRVYSARKSWTGKLTDLKSASPKQLLSRNLKGETLLHVACIKGEIETVKKLLESGFDPNVKDFADWTPLHEACNHGYGDICDLLVRHGALVDACGDGNCTPLHDAIFNSRLDCVQVLLKYGASLTQRNANGLNAMELETSSEVKLLLEQYSKNKEVHKNPDRQEHVVIDEEMPLKDVVVTTSGFDEDSQNEIAEIVKKLKWKFTESFTTNVTHVVAKLSDKNTCRRTLKTMSAILLGRWIINEQWLKTAEKKGDWVEENRFMMKFCGVSRKDKAPSKSRLAYKRQLPLLFNGCSFFISHGIHSALKDDLTHLIKLGGGSILTREPKLDNINDSSSSYQSTVPFHVDEESKLRNCCYFVVCQDSDFESRGNGSQKGNGSHALLVFEKLCRVNATWIFDCISQYSIIDE